MHISSNIPRLDGDWEEADLRLVPHAWDAAQQGFQRIVITSPDNDVLVFFTLPIN